MLEHYVEPDLDFAAFSPRRLIDEASMAIKIAGSGKAGEAIGLDAEGNRR